METDHTDYAHVREVWLAQKKTEFELHESHVLRKRAGVAVSFEQLSAALAGVGDTIRKRATAARQPRDASGRTQYGEGFALVDQGGMGLFVRVRESGERDAPSYTYFHATSVGLGTLVFAADLALVDDFTLAPISTPEILSIIIQANLSRAEMDAVHACIARACASLGYVSDTLPSIGVTVPPGSPVT